MQPMQGARRQTERQRCPQPVCDNCGRFVPFKYGPNDFEWWSGGYCKPGKGCQKQVNKSERQNDEA